MSTNPYHLPVVPHPNEPKRSSGDQHTTISDEQSKLEGNARAHGNWFFVMAFATIASTFSIMLGGKYSFMAGFALPLLFAVGVAEIRNENDPEKLARITTITVVSTVICAGISVLFGVMVLRGHSWPFILGVFLYSFDTLFFLALFQFGSVVAHLFGLVILARGAVFSHKLKKLNELNSFQPDFDE